MIHHRASRRDIPLGLIVNTAARAVKRRYLNRTPFWREHLHENSIRLTDTLTELDDAVAAFRKAGVRVVATLGGDGTLHHFVAAVLEHYGETETPVVLPLAGGTLNGIARALGAGKPPDRLLPWAIDVLARGEAPVEARPVLRVSDAVDGRVRYGFGLAAGVPFRIAQRYYRAREPGLSHAIWTMIALPLGNAIFGGRLFEGLELDVRADGVPWLADASHTVVASVLDAPLLWFRPFGAPLGEADAFHLGATNMRPRQMASRLWSIYRGRCTHHRLRTGPSRDAIVRGESGYLIDGELYSGGGRVDVRVTVGPRLRFLVPRARATVLS